MSPERQRRRWIVRGRVQGVGFRWFVTRQAARLDAHGWVRNLRDGTVEVVCEGVENVLEALEQALAAGPPGARVEGIERAVLPPDVSVPTTFEIR